MRVVTHTASFLSGVAAGVVGLLVWASVEHIHQIHGR